MFLLDSNAFIEAKNLYYGFSIAPGFWEWVYQVHESGSLASVPAVREELVQQDDELSEWVNELPESFWLTETSQTVDALRLLADWAMNQAPRLRQQARTDFLASADYRLIAEAYAGSHTVVTREQSAPSSIRRILIPDACHAHSVACESPFNVYEALGLKLRLNPEP